MTSHRPARRRLRSLAVAALVLAAAPSTAGSAAAAGQAPDFGPNVKVLDPSMSTAQIKATVDAIAARQVPHQFGDGRFALLFEPGTYGSATDPLNFQVGYYTDVAGLGASPDDVTIHGTVDALNQCDASGSCTALTNFWRSLSNLRIDVAGKTGCPGFGEFWATSQAAPMRRVDVHGPMTLMDFCTNPAFASGGVIADSRFSAQVINGSQQQYLVRDSELGGGWSNAVWNQVFAGVQGAPAQSFPTPPFTTLDRDPVSREKPFLQVDAAGRYSVFVPAARTDSTGTTWGAAPAAGRAIPISRFFIARPSDSVKTINRALSRGQNLIFTPGVYDIDRTIEVKRRDTIVLGLGLATFEAQDGVVPRAVDGVPGVDVAGLLFDAGPVNSPVLLRVGKAHGNNHADASDPTALQDVFFRIGGAHVGRATVSLAVNSDHVILDDIWAWRADHGAGVGWTTNTADNGVVVNGDDVSASGLFVEHYQRYEVVWNGERGRTIMFQNEMPYDPPDQASFQHDGILGWAAYKVAADVGTHEGFGLGSYAFFEVNPAIHAAHAFEVPERPGVRLHDILSLSITNAGTIDHVVNDFGPPTDANTNPSDVVEFPPTG
jgi:hypothetical protein